MDVQELTDKINRGEIEAATLLIRSLAENNRTEAIPALIKQLETAEHPIIWNAIAIALADFGDPIAVPPLIRLLIDPKTIRSRGSLVYALESFDCIEYSDVFVNLLLEGNYETSRQAYLLLEKLRGDIPREARERYVDALQQRIGELEEQIEFLLDSVDLFK